MTLGGGGGRAITNDVLKFRKIIELQIHKLVWAANELCTSLIINKKRSSNIYKISKKLAN